MTRASVSKSESLAVGLSSSGNPSKPIVHVAMRGARLHYAVPQLLERAGMLGTFYTDIYLGNKPWLSTLLKRIPPGLKPSVLERLQGRVCEEIPPGKIVSFDRLGLKSFWLRSRGRSASELNILYARTGRAFCEGIVRSGLETADAVYGFRCGSLEIFREAKRLGLALILEQFMLS